MRAVRARLLSKARNRFSLVFLSGSTVRRVVSINQNPNGRGVKGLTVCVCGGGLLLVGQQRGQHRRVLHQDGVGSLDVDRVRRLSVHW